MRVGEPVDLRVHRGEHIRVAMAEARHGGAARRVEILLARGVGEVDAATPDGDGRRHAQIAVEDMRHREIAAVEVTPGRCRRLWYSRPDSAAACYDG